MNHNSRSREREIVLQRFLELTPADQLGTYREMRDFLAARLTLVTRDTAVEERTASLDVLRQVVEHLALPGGVAPTPTQFDAVCRELDLGWNRSRVSRAWGRWRFGKDAFLGHDHDSAVRRRLRSSVGDRRRRNEAPLRAIRLWLASEPAGRDVRAYGAWAREYNSELQEGDLPVVQSAHKLSGQLGIRWPDLVQYVAGEIALVDARRPFKRVRARYCRGPHDLVAVGDVASILGCAKWTAGQHTAKHSFPQAVVDLPGTRLWLRSDVEAYWQEKPFPQRLANEFRSVYMTVDEVADAAGIARHTVLRGQRGFPEAAVNLGSVRLWLRSEIETWRPDG